LPTLQDLDGRSAAYRRAIELIGAIERDLGGDLTALQQELVKRAATLSVWCEAQDVQAFSGVDIDCELYGRIASHLRRVAEALGLERKSRDVTPPLSQYLAKSRTRAPTTNGEG
jgi:hypothetical protein